MKQRLQCISKIKFTGDANKDLLILKDAVQKEFDYVERDAVDIAELNTREKTYVLKGEPERLVRVVATDAEQTDIATSAAETEIVALVIPKGMLGDDDFARITLIGSIINNMVGAGTVRVRIYLNRNVVYDSTATVAGAAGTADVDRYPFFSYIILAAKQASNSQILGGVILIGDEPATSGWGDLSTDETAATTPIGGQGSEDSTMDILLTASITLGTSHADLRFRKTYASLEVSHAG